MKNKIKLGIFFVTLVLFLMGTLSFLISAKTTFAYESAPSDSQETIIKQVLKETGAELAWNLGDCFYTTPVSEGATSVRFCPEVWGPRLMYDLSGDDLVGMPGAAYGLDVPILYGGWANEFLPMKIMAHPTEAIAKTAMPQDIEMISDVFGFKKIKFHNYPAITSDAFGTVEWQADRFFFTANGGDIGISADEIAEALYANAVKYGLIAGEGGEEVVIPVQDSDGDGVTDDIDQCPGTLAGLAVDLSGCPLGEMSLTIFTDKNFYSPEDIVIIQGHVEDLTGGFASAVVTFDVSTTDYSANTKATADLSGNYRLEFPIPIDISQATFTLSATVSFPNNPSINKSVNFAVGENSIVLEENATSGESFIGIAADGITSLDISISLPVCKDGCSDVKIKQLDIGKLEGDAIDSTGNLKLDSNGMAEISYFPPDYLSKDQLTRNINVHKSGSKAWFAEVPLILTFTDISDQEGKIEAEILVSRPPVVLVHGFLGATATWAKMSTFLNGEKFDTYLGNYGATDQSIEGLSLVLKHDIQKQKLDYAKSNIKLEKVDLVGHSMGALISRYYSNGLSDYPDDVRKLIMVATPNHGVSWTKKIIGNIGAEWYQTHRIPATQLYSESSFMKTLNSGEKNGAHLKSNIQYGNIYGYPDDWVVSAASAYLNGVNNLSISDVKHSPDVPLVPFVAITEYLKTWEQVEKWLNNDIYRPLLKGTRVEIHKYSGDVYLDGNKLDSSPTIFNSWQSLRTGQDSNAIIRLTLNDIPWGIIFLDSESEIFLGHISPQLVEVRLWKGSARFRTKKDGHFTVPINIKNSENGEWWKYSPKAVVTGLNTDFAVIAGENIEVHSLEGMLVIDTPDAVEKGSILSTNDSVVVDGETIVAIDSVSKDEVWWSSEDDNFLNFVAPIVEDMDIDKMSLKSIGQDIKDNSIASITFIIALSLLIFFLFFAMLKFAKKKIGIGISIIILGIISFCVFGGITLFFAINFDDSTDIVINTVPKADLKTDIELEINAEIETETAIKPSTITEDTYGFTLELGEEHIDKIKLLDIDPGSFAMSSYAFCYDSKEEFEDVIYCDLGEAPLFFVDVMTQTQWEETVNSEYGGGYFSMGERDGLFYIFSHLSDELPSDVPSSEDFYNQVMDSFEFSR